MDVDDPLSFRVVPLRDRPEGSASSLKTSWSGECVRRPTIRPSSAYPSALLRSRLGNVSGTPDDEESGTGIDGRILFFVASRGHHADIGGTIPSSMSPDARTVEEEGILFDNFALVDGGRFLKAELRVHLGPVQRPARNPDHNVADLKVRIAARKASRKCAA